ncbi:Hypothetical protein NTJ_00804 [Nesidiocoris tenuis]|uniref:Ig-like domain-containing protein n=1 Tax=Nesidiocoris tenuis TaxID=355587 RepID=A0ABN7A7Q6_9HEMI|nr:Hypothetical protein NTJ_00804 [Nesidiocoris tenuis]
MRDVTWRGVRGTTRSTLLCYATGMTGRRATETGAHWPTCGSRLKARRSPPRPALAAPPVLLLCQSSTSRRAAPPAEREM